MTQSNYEFPVNGVSGPGFAANIDTAFDAAVSNNSGTAPPSTLIPRMFWADTTANELKMLGPDNLTFLTLFPDITAPYGGLDTFILNQVVLPGTGNFATRSGANTFESVNTFNSDVVFNNVASFNSPVTGPTEPQTTNNNRLASTEYVRSAISGINFPTPELGGSNFVDTQSLGFGTTRTFTHSFGYTPVFNVYLVSNTSTYGYSPGHQVDITSLPGTGPAIRVDESAVEVIIPASLSIVRRDNRQVDGVSITDWNIRVRAWR